MSSKLIENIEFKIYCDIGDGKTVSKCKIPTMSKVGQFNKFLNSEILPCSEFGPNNVFFECNFGHNCNFGHSCSFENCSFDELCKFSDRINMKNCVYRGVKVKKFTNISNLDGSNRTVLIIIDENGKEFIQCGGFWGDLASFVFRASKKNYNLYVEVIPLIVNKLKEDFSKCNS